jgi:hypothetical protein
MINLDQYPEYEEKKYVIDGANICWYGVNGRTKSCLKNLILMLEELKSIGIKEDNILIFCDATLRHKIDQPNKYISLTRKKRIIETPAGIKTDEFILNYCLRHDDSLFISNDLFREYYDQLPDLHWIIHRRLTYLIIDEEVLIIPMEKKRR